LAKVPFQVIFNCQTYLIRNDSCGFKSNAHHASLRL
jgi:hypothetical protein